MMAGKNKGLPEELRGMQAEPLLPVEKKLIVGSLLLGAVLLVLLIWLSDALSG